MKLYNTLAKRLETFTPLEPGLVRMYNCGPTVYGEQHLGNFRTFAFADTLRRWFEAKGWRVIQIVNITDVGHLTRDDIEQGDDKIMVKARQLGWTPLEVAEHFMRSFLSDRRTLGFQEPARFTRATEHIHEMIALIRRLLDAGRAYAVGGNVYFDVTKFPSYGRLSGNSLEALKAGARVEVNPQKRHPADFALWKTDPNHLMQWDAPWGRGFPGWHVECSAMSMKYLGETFDLHTGGEDNIFPHHECEIAQSEAATGKPFVRFWVHARHVMWEGQKISKSLRNVILIRDALGRGYWPDEIRYVLVSAHYRKQVNFSWQLFEDARQSVARLREFSKRLAAAAARPDGGELPDLERFEREFGERMDDDLDVSGALGILHSFAREGNRALDRGLSGAPVRRARELLGRLDRVFGILPLGGEERPPEEVVRLVEERQQARRARDFDRADALRRRIRDQGWIVEDTQEGVTLKRASGSAG